MTFTGRLQFASEISVLLHMQLQVQYPFLCMCIFFLERERDTLFTVLSKTGSTYFRSYQLTVRVKMNSPGFSMWGSSGSVMESSVAEIPCKITVNIQSFVLCGSSTI